MPNLPILIPRAGLRLSLVLVLISQALVAADAVAESKIPDCPGSIATIAGTDVAHSATEILKPLYRKLGCTTRFIEFPGVRGIVEFNRGGVGGESIRITAAESEYSREFVRSYAPVMHVQRALWVDPNQAGSSDLPIGFQLGVIWQKRYASQRQNMIQFYSMEEMFQAYDQGRIGGFLATYTSEQTLLSSLRSTAVLEKQLPSKMLYHYLGKEFTPLMQRISQQLAEQ